MSAVERGFAKLVPAKSCGAEQATSGRAKLLLASWSTAKRGDAGMAE